MMGEARRHGSDTMKLLLLACAVAACAGALPEAAALPWWRREHLRPAPASVRLGSGRLVLEQSSLELASTGLPSTIVDAALQRLPPLLFGASAQQCRLPPCNATRACNATTELGQLKKVEVRLTKEGGNWSGLRHGADESYTLDVSAAGVASVVAPTAAGAVHGLETLAQLVKLSFDGVASICSAPLKIADKPRFGWRGMMVDSSRHFLPVPLLLKMIDALAAGKGNVLHWHFMDVGNFALPALQLVPNPAGRSFQDKEPCLLPPRAFTINLTFR